MGGLSLLRIGLIYCHMTTEQRLLRTACSFPTSSEMRRNPRDLQTVLGKGPHSASLSLKENYRDNRKCLGQGRLVVLLWSSHDGCGESLCAVLSWCSCCKLHTLGVIAYLFSPDVYTALETFSCQGESCKGSNYSGQVAGSH